eukprot:TRINITY_DN60257_c0_g1_i1.p1 TRINITY_DN60257_c0_g1~~TRINITY_DN60257_c0_g1_i1.p1  ORF type:complete len:616 (+),score=75.83 TRINITY_DN60257_c0_g1_i1:20-1867(+)
MLDKLKKKEKKLRGRITLYEPPAGVQPSGNKLSEFITRDVVFDIACGANITGSQSLGYDWKIPLSVHQLLITVSEKKLPTQRDTIDLVKVRVEPDKMQEGEDISQRIQTEKGGFLSLNMRIGKRLGQNILNHLPGGHGAATMPAHQQQGTATPNYSQQPGQYPGALPPKTTQGQGTPLSGSFGSSAGQSFGSGSDALGHSQSTPTGGFQQPQPPPNTTPQPGAPQSRDVGQGFVIPPPLVPGNAPVPNQPHQDFGAPPPDLSHLEFYAPAPLVPGGCAPPVTHQPPPQQQQQGMPPPQFHASTVPHQHHQPPPQQQPPGAATATQPSGGSSRYTVIKHLGQGGQGSVCLVDLHYKGFKYTTQQQQGNQARSTERVALKKIKCSTLEEANLALEEVKCLMDFKHASIIGYKDFFLEEIPGGGFNVCLAMELCPNGDVYHYIRDHGLPDNNTAIRWMFQICSALVYLHEEGKEKVIHRDIKPTNIFLDSTCQAKLGDLGLIRRKNFVDEMIKTQVGTFLYWAPEILDQKDYDEKVDIWAVGCTFYEAFAQKQRTINREILTNPNLITEMRQDLMTKGFSSQLADIILSTIRLQPHERPPASELSRRLSLLAQAGGRV